MRFLKYFIPCSFLILAFTPIDFVEKIISAFKNYNDKLPQEKVYLHVNQSSFSAGEIIWFKAYLTAGPENIPSPLSSTVYVELIDSKNKVLEQVKLYKQEGSAPGSLHIPDSLRSGNYSLRAYTRWMRNFDENYFFHRAIKVFNAGKTEHLDSERPIDVQFFPEGGQWVQGFTSKIAFKALGEDGRGKKIKGKIIEDGGRVVTSFESNFLGMGYCELAPGNGHSYRAVIDASSFEIKLPEVQESGVTLSVTNKPEQDHIVVRIQNNTAQKTFYLVALCRGAVDYISKISTPGPITFVTIPKEEFSTGIMQLTLANEANLPIAERLIFIDMGDALHVDIKADKEVYEPREKVTLQIDVRDRNGKHVASDFSLAVSDDTQVSQDSNYENIFSYLYLASDLKGHIESSGYYFNKKNPDRFEALDALLLTQGWRRFSYEQVLDGNIPEPVFLSQWGLAITGTMIDKSSQNPAVKGKVKYLNTFPSPELKIVTTDKSGRFEISPVIYFDSVKVILQGENRRGETAVNFLVDTIPDSPPTEFVLPSSTIIKEKTIQKEYFTQRGTQQAFDLDPSSTMLPTIDIKAKRIITDKERMLRFYGTPSVNIQVAGNEVLENLPSMDQILLGRVAGITLDAKGNIIIRAPGSIMGSSAPLVLVDNARMAFGGNVRDIESISVYKGAAAAAFGMTGANGAIIIYTKRGANSPPQQRSYKAFRGGYQSFRRFYSPHYDIKSPDHNKWDFRATLLWAPNIKTDTSGRTTVTFFNHDLETTVSGVLEGMVSTGQVGTGTFHYKIKNRVLSETK